MGNLYVNGRRPVAASNRSTLCQLGIISFLGTEKGMACVSNPFCTLSRVHSLKEEILENQLLQADPAHLI